MDAAGVVRKARKTWAWAELILDIFMLVFAFSGVVFAVVVVVKAGGHRLRNVSQPIYPFSNVSSLGLF